MQPSSITPKMASPVDASAGDSDNIPGIICQLRALEAAVDDKEAASIADDSAANGPGKMPRGQLALRLACAVAALLPLWAGWVVFAYFYTQSTLWPLPRTALNASDTVASIALVASVLLVALVPLLTTLALLHATRTRTLWLFALVFLGATLLALAPVFAIYGALRTHPCSTEVTAYLSSGTLQLFSTHTGQQVGAYDYARPARGPSGDLDFLLQPQSSSSSDSSTPLAFVYDPERRVAGLSSGGYTISFPEGAFRRGEGTERFTLRADRGLGPVVLQSLGRAPTPGGHGTLKVCAEKGERALVAMAVASWVYTREY